MERKGDFISTNIRYKKETEVVTFQGKEITLENLSPVFTPEQEAAKRREEKRGSPLHAEKVVPADGEFLRAVEKVQGHNQ